ncbi:MAG: rhomboid family intramembrane serine protease [Euryarchaeota archaeon]|nr:rhomboid family intramembrane serine protease [Euryarchaeota archaeon]
MKGKFTLSLFIITVLVFVYQVRTGALMGLIPSELHPSELVGYAFFHSSSTHLTLNLLALLFFGYHLEEKIGTEKMILLFFITTIFAGIVYVLIYPHSETACVGLSGFIFGTISANLVVYKGKHKNYLLLSAFFYILLTVFLIYVDTVGKIAHAAHLGGFLMGSVMELCYEKRKEGYILILMTILSTAYLVIG